MPLSKNENLISQNSPSGLKRWVLASRPKTWIAGLSPVVIGTSLSGFVSWSLFFFALSFSLLIQIGTNFANDYFDYLQGADLVRVGPSRAVTGGWITPIAMRNAWIITFIAAFFISLPLIATSGMWALIFVFSSIAFGILYTGGPYPLGYMGLGELLVLPYFGPIAVSGAYFVQRQSIDSTVIMLSLCPGLLSCAILIANNLRDEVTDKIAKKNTLVVLFGKTFGSCEYAICVIAPIFLPLFFGYFATLLLTPFAFFLIYKAFTFQTSGEAAPILAQTALLLLTFTALFCTEIMLH